MLCAMITPRIAFYLNLVRVGMDHTEGGIRILVDLSMQFVGDAIGFLYG
jgi:hypothetical protein